MPLPFRLGTTSHIYDDDLVGNVRRLGPLVDDIELVLFDTETHGANIPDAAAVAELNRLAMEHRLTYTVHLPMDLWPEHDSLKKAARAIAATRALHPYAYIAHLDGRALPPAPTPRNTAEWVRKSGDALDAVIAGVGDPARICVENLERWDPSLFDDLVRARGLGRCVDIGHLWLTDAAAAPAYLGTHLAGAAVLHLHGVAERDHVSLAYAPADDLRAISALLSGFRYPGVVTLEVFSEADFLGSLRVLERCFRAGEP